ncbi:MAG: hypothetical protein U1E73_03010 [Planctomycetota bacterium]
MLSFGGTLCLLALVFGAVAIAYIAVQCVALLVLDGHWRLWSAVPAVIIAVVMVGLPTSGWLLRLAGCSVGGLAALGFLFALRRNCDRGEARTDADVPRKE